MNSSRFQQLDWDIDFLATNTIVRSKRFGIPAEAKSVRFPLRLLRYWFGYHLLRTEAEHLGRPLEIAETGVHTGQMLEFYRSCPNPPAYAAWTAVDAVVLGDKLKKAGYDDVVEGNLESPDFDLPRDFDAVVMLHILEHLFDPEAALQRIAKRLRPGGVVIGGFPVVPEAFREIRENKVRAHAAPMGHVSVFSPQRVENMAEKCGMKVEFSAGAYFIRSKGSRLENSPLWMRFNLLWGGVFPGWPGEIYWLMRKPV